MEGALCFFSQFKSNMSGFLVYCFCEVFFCLCFYLVGFLVGFFFPFLNSTNR